MWRELLSRHVTVTEEDESGAAGPAETNLVAGAELAFGHGLAAEEGAEARLPIAQDEATLFLDDFGVVAGNFGAAEPEMVALAPPDQKRRLTDRDVPVTELILDLQARLAHGAPESTRVGGIKTG
jgi:hypothetical protein